MANQVFKSGNVLGVDKVRVHKDGNRIDGVSHDNELFWQDLPIPKRSNIDLSFDRKLSFNMGELVPILCQECVPGDTFHIAQAHNLMFAPQIAPLFQRIDYRTYYFFVPNRLVSDNWKDFITLKNTNVTPAYFTGTNTTVVSNGVNSLLDYFDLPVQESNWIYNQRKVLAYPFRAYNLIWNEYFRDEFKQNEISITKTDGIVNTTELQTYVVRKLGWERDYFTTCQTTPQVGPDVNIPVDIARDPSNPNLTFNNGSGSSSSSPSSGTPTVQSNGTITTGSGQGTTPLGYKSGLITTGTINDLRIANHLQEYRDKLRLGGERYNEAILAEFGVVVPDYRIQRPEYIGGFAQPIETGAIYQDTPTSSSPLGAYAGRSLGSGRMDYAHYNCLEHGYIIGLCTVMPRSSYYQGIPRHLLKDTVMDWYHPDFATLGDQAVYTDEIMVQSNSSATYPPYHRFGYNQRYSEYKMNQDRVNGEFRTSLNFWHMARQFSSTPTLNGSFIEADPTTRIFAVQNNANKIYAEIYQDIKSVRPMPVSVQPNLTNVE